MASEKVLGPEEWCNVHDWFITQVSFSIGTFQFPLAYTGELEIVVDRVIVVAPTITGPKAIAVAWDDDAETVDGGSTYLVGTSSAGETIGSNQATVFTPSKNNVVPRNKHLSYELSGTGTSPTALIQVAYRTKRK